MNDTIGLFLELLKAALWKQYPGPAVKQTGTNHSCLTNADWNGVRRIAEKQAVAGLMADGISLLPQDMMPPFEMKMRFIADAMATARRNAEMAREMQRVCTLLQNSNVKVAFFKGQIAGARYSNPDHRTPGDVDFISDNPALAERLMVEHRGKLGGIVPKHAEIWMDGVLFESHRMALDLAYPPSQAYFNRQIRRMLHEGVGKECVGDMEMPCLTPALEVCHCTAHINHHFLEVGIGLRQIADFAMLLTEKKSLIDIAELRRHLCGTHMLRFFRALEALCVEHLGMPEEAVVIPYGNGDKKNGLLIMQSAINGGNFGRYDGKDKSNGFRRMVISMGKAMRYFRMSPLEALFRPTMTVRVWLWVHRCSS